MLFGSRARGDARADSDLDLLVIVRDLLTPERQKQRFGGGTADRSGLGGRVGCCRLAAAGDGSGSGVACFAYAFSGAICQDQRPFGSAEVGGIGPMGLGHLGRLLYVGDQVKA